MKNVFDRSHSYPPLEKIPDVPAETENLFLFRNKIKNIVFLNRYENITRLDLSDNQITTLCTFEQIPNLKILDLSFNLLNNVDELFIDSLSNIEELYLHCNDIDDFKSDREDCCKEIENFKNLLNFNFFNKHLKKLDLANNLFHQIPIVNKNIEELYLACNHIRDITYHFNGNWSVKNLKVLKILGLENNLISKIDCKNLPQSLTHLMLSENEYLLKLENIDYLKNLVFLDLSQTKILLSKLNLNKKIKVFF